MQKDVLRNFTKFTGKNTCARVSFLIKLQACPHIETSQFICTANQLTGFYMRVGLQLYYKRNSGTNVFL